MVIDSLTGKPLPRAKVQIAGRALLTGPQGEFSLEGLSRGGTTAIANKPGYFEEPAVTNIQVGPDTGKIVLKLTPEAIITGRVIGRDDEPLEGVNIRVFTFHSMDGFGRRLTPAGGGINTDEDGNFRLSGLRAGRYYLMALAGHVRRDSLGTPASKPAQNYPPVVFYPGAADLAAAAALDLAPGQRLETQFSLSLLPAYKLAGTLAVAGEWKHVNPPSIMNATGELLLSVKRYDPQSGAFEFPEIPAGAYTVLLSGQDAQEVYQASERLITVSKDVMDLKLSLVPGANIPVIARTEFSEPFHGSCSSSSANGVQHSDCSDYPVVRVTLTSANSSFRQITTPFAPASDPSALQLHGVAPGKYLVRAQASFRGYVQSVRCGAQDLMREELTVAEGGSVIPIEVVVRDDLATLHVVARASQPGQPAAIVILRDGVLSSAAYPLTGASETRFMGVPPGTYKVFAFDSPKGIDFADPEVMAKYASQAVTVTLGAKENGSVAVNVIHTGD